METYVPLECDVGHILDVIHGSERVLGQNEAVRVSTLEVEVHGNRLATSGARVVVNGNGLRKRKSA